MRVLSFILLFLSFACAHKKASRAPAFLDELSLNYGPIDFTKSTVRLFPPELDGGYHRYYFYVELKDAKGVFVDCDQGEISIKNERKADVDFRLERLLAGRYYVILEAPKEIKTSTLDFYVRGRALQERFKLVLQEPVIEKSKIRIVENKEHKVKMHLTLQDSQGNPVSLPGKPELILEGDGRIEGLTQVQDGLWEFSIKYSEQNHIMYISVRAQGVYLQDLYRFQHVEK